MSFALLGEWHFFVSIQTDIKPTVVTIVGFCHLTRGNAACTERSTHYAERACRSRHHPHRGADKGRQVVFYQISFIVPSVSTSICCAGFPYQHALFLIQSSSSQKFDPDSSQADADWKIDRNNGKTQCTEWTAAQVCTLRRSRLQFILLCTTAPDTPRAGIRGRYFGSKNVKKL